MEQNKKELLMEQANKMESVLNVLRAQFLVCRAYKWKSYSPSER